jgi:hypothetical protein
MVLFLRAFWKLLESAGADIGGEGGIRTLETVARLHAFQACAFDHSATSPWKKCRTIAERPRGSSKPREPEPPPHVRLKQP